MAKIETIKSYLVSLGFAVTEGELRKFKDTLKDITQDVERVAAGMTKGFAVAGATIAGVLTGVGVGVLDLMNNTARADLGFQVFARRMYMGVDAAKQMKIATDALGYSLEDIIWGPKELRDRYGTLISDQRKMNAGLGPDFETQMKRIRDVRFEFTRMGVEVEYFGMQLTRSLMDKLFGGADSLDKRLDQLNNWFQAHIPQLADHLSKDLAPILEHFGSIAEKIFTVKNIDWTINIVGKGLDKIEKVIDWLSKASDSGFVQGFDTGAQKRAWWGGAPDWRHAWDKGEIKKETERIAREHHIDPALFASIINQESGFNPNAYNAKSGAAGLGQLMPGTARQLGITDVYNPLQNLEGAARLFEGLLGQYGERGALKHYGGFVNENPDNYIDSILKRAEKYRHPNKGLPNWFLPSSLHGGGVDIGGVTVNVAGSNAHPHDIANAVIHAIEGRMGRRVQDNLTQFTGVYA